MSIRNFIAQNILSIQQFEWREAVQFKYSEGILSFVGESEEPFFRFNAV